MSIDDNDDFVVRPIGESANTAASASEQAALLSMLQRDREWEATHASPAARAAALQTLTPEEVIAVAGPRPANRRISPVMLVIIALAALLGIALALILVTRANADSPAETAMRSFTEQKAALQIVERDLAQQQTDLTQAKDEAIALSSSTAGSIAAVVGVSDETARLAAEAQRLDFEKAVKALVVADFTRAPLAVPTIENPDSLQSIAPALNELAAEKDRLKVARTDLREVRASLQAVRKTYTQQFTTFGKTIPAAAAGFVIANPDAGQPWRDAVTSAAAAITTDLAAGRTTTNAFQSYAAAVLALQADNARALAETPAEAEEPYDESDSGREDVGPSGPTSEQPPAVEPPITETPPAEPPVTDPPVTEPPVTEPPAG